SLLKLVAGRFSDRGPRRFLVIGGYALPAIARAGIAAALAPWHVLGARLLGRAGEGGGTGPRDALLADSVLPSQRGRAFGLNRSLDDLGAAVGPLIASGMLMLGMELRTTFAVASVFGLMAPILLFYRLKDYRTATDRSGAV